MVASLHSLYQLLFRHRLKHLHQDSGNDNQEGGNKKQPNHELGRRGHYPECLELSGLFRLLLNGLFPDIFSRGHRYIENFLILICRSRVFHHGPGLLSFKLCKDASERDFARCSLFLPVLLLRLVFFIEPGPWQFCDLDLEREPFQIKVLQAIVKGNSVSVKIKVKLSARFSQTGSAESCPKLSWRYL